MRLQNQFGMDRFTVVEKGDARRRTLYGLSDLRCDQSRLWQAKTDPAHPQRGIRPRDIEWEISLTQKSGDAERFARQAAENGADIVAAYGGDGTVMEVARGIMGLDTPLAIFPGGTANLMAVELGIPKNLQRLPSWQPMSIRSSTRSTWAGLGQGISWCGLVRVSPLARSNTQIAS